MVDQNLEVRRMSNATIMVKKGTSRKSVGTTKREERVKIMSYQMFRGVYQVPRMMAKFSTAMHQLFQRVEYGYLTSGLWT